MELIVLTIFPEMIQSYLQSSILGKALQKNIYSLKVINIRDFTIDKHHKVDDIPFGGGSGMVMKPEPLFAALESLTINKNDRVICPTPTGIIFTQPKAKEFAVVKGRLIFICGRYEGIDQRVIDTWVTDEISIGNFVVTGGELPALLMIDATLRMIPGVVGKEESIINDSFYHGENLDHPHYTRPADFRGLKVPAVLLEGNHKEISKWRSLHAQQKNFSQNS
jgi:tRNA (guanine37-N1)-methyltransferase